MSTSGHSEIRRLPLFSLSITHAFDVGNFPPSSIIELWMLICICCLSLCVSRRQRHVHRPAPLLLSN